MARKYSTQGRASQTAAIRLAVIDSATASLLEHGYLATTIAQVAVGAGVSVQTVYNVVGGKPALLKAVYDTMLAGDAEPLPIAGRPEIAQLLSAADPRSALAWYAALARALAGRVLPLLTMVAAQAASGDVALREFSATIERERAIGAAATAHHIAERFGLRDDVDEQGAADILWTLTAPELADRLVNGRQWGWDRFQPWLAGAMADALLGPWGDRVPGTGTHRPARRTSAPS